MKPTFPKLFAGPGAHCFIGLAVAAVLCGCGPKSLDRSQVLARVNGQDITVHQMKFALSQRGASLSAPENDTAMLDKLIDRQLVVQQALERGLDRQPDVMIRLEEARRDILAAAYAFEVSAQKPPPRDEAVSAYYARNPALFAERKLYLLREVTIPEDNTALAEAQQRLSRKNDLTDVAAWLQKQGGQFTDQVVQRAAEQIPVEAVDPLSRLKPGETIAFRFPKGLVVYQVQHATPAHLSWAEASPLIYEHLRRQQEGADVRLSVKRLRDMAQIERQSVMP